MSADELDRCMRAGRNALEGAAAAGVSSSSDSSSEDWKQKRSGLCQLASRVDSRYRAEKQGLTSSLAAAGVSSSEDSSSDDCEQNRLIDVRPVLYSVGELEAMSALTSSSSFLEAPGAALTWLTLDSSSSSELDSSSDEDSTGGGVGAFFYMTTNVERWVS